VPTEALQQGPDLEALQHRLGVFGRERRQRDLDIAHQLDQHPAGADHDDRAELGIALDPEDELEPALHHLGDDAGLGGGIEALQGGRDLGERGPDGSAVGKTEPHETGVALVHHRVADALQHDRIADRLGRRDGFRGAAHAPFARNAEPSSGEQRLRLGLAQIAGMRQGGCGRRSGRHLTWPVIGPIGEPGIEQPEAVIEPVAIAEAALADDGAHAGCDRARRHREERGLAAGTKAVGERGDGLLVVGDGGERHEDDADIGIGGD
jgi:hypothetical protein